MSDARRIGIDNHIKGNRSITLWVKVDGENFVLFEHESTSKIHGRRRLPYPTFIVRNGNDTCRARGKDLCHFRSLPCCHVSRPSEVELRSLSMIKPRKENYNGCSREVLTMILDPSLLAHVEHRAGGATRSAPHTNMLAKRYQQTVDLHPVLPRQHGFESQHRAFRSTLGDIAPAVGNTMNMDVDPNKRLLTRNAQDQMSAFGTSTHERAQDLAVTPQCSTMVSHNPAGNRVYLQRFGLMEGAGVDSVVIGFWGELAHGKGCACQGKQPAGAGQSDCIQGTDRDDTGNEQLER